MMLVRIYISEINHLPEGRPWLLFYFLSPSEAKLGKLPHLEGFIEKFGDPRNLQRVILVVLLHISLKKQGPGVTLV